MTVPIVSIPEGAEVLIRGTSYGRSPVEVRLTEKWWESHIVAVFGVGDDLIETEVSRERLMAAFNHNTCAMANVVIKSPEPQNEAKIKVEKSDIEAPVENQPRNELMMKAALTAVAIETEMISRILQVLQTEMIVKKMHRR